MSGIFTVLSDSSTSLFRLKQTTAKGYGEGPATLADKAAAGQMQLQAKPDQLRAMQTAMTALEESRRINNPKAQAEDRMAKVEHRMRELRAEARLAAARGDREKLAQLAHEAAQLAREAGKAAKEYSLGVSAAAALGKGATTGSAAGATQTTSVTTVQAVSVEMTVQVHVHLAQPADTAEEAIAAATAALGGDSSAGTLVADGAMAPADDPAAGDPTGDPVGTDADAADPTTGGASISDLVKQARQLLGDDPSGDASTAGRGQQYMQKLMQDNDLKMSRYKEADAFARRVERVLTDVKAVISDAKLANETDADEARRRDRREAFKEDDKALGEARDAVQDLRGAALESGVSAGDPTGALLDAMVGADGTAAAPPVTAAAVAAPAALNVVA